ncbi:MAG: PilZ domain-containing protein [Thermoanaerobaculaceae bacterium]|jgi:hypothetical protein|nr:PilZ domain-containing protein [Thermoanaerobaculaceae bacterium]
MSRELLIIGSLTPALRRVMPMLDRAEFRSEYVARGDEAIELVHARRFDLIVARFPLVGAGLAELVRAVRADGGPSRGASFLLLAEPEHVSDVGTFLGRGIGRIVSLDAPSERLVDAVADLLAVAPRRALRAIVEVRLPAQHGGGQLLALTHNISENGLLLAGVPGLPIGATLSFELSLPGVAAPIRGEAEVVRHTDPTREKVDGIGARIISFVGDGHERLQAFLTRPHHP